MDPDARVPNPCKRPIHLVLISESIVLLAIASPAFYNYSKGCQLDRYHLAISKLVHICAKSLHGTEQSHSSVQRTEAEVNIDTACML